MAAMRPDWLEVRVAVMLAAVRVKFGSNPELRAMLLATGDAEIINFQLSTFNFLPRHQLSTFNFQLSTFNFQLSTFNFQLPRHQ